jgi:hypothetical protein
MAIQLAIGILLSFVLKEKVPENILHLTYSGRQ